MKFTLRLGSILALWVCQAAWAQPAQRLPSAYLVYPLIVSEGSRDTRIELVNLTRTPKRLHCFYIHTPGCFETDFFLSLTPNQPMSWLASQGTVNNQTFSAAPPFFGRGELKCIVLPSQEDVSEHNGIQGRAIVFGADGQTIGYGAVGFQRLVPGPYTGVLDLNDVTYAACPAELHFIFLASDTASDSELLLVPCTQDIFNANPTQTVVQFRVINEFEQQLSASMTVQCFSLRTLQSISNVFTRNTLGTATGHLVVRGVQSPLLGMIIDRFTPGAELSTSANEPILRGSRSASVIVPPDI